MVETQNWSDLLGQVKSVRIGNYIPMCSFEIRTSEPGKKVRLLGITVKEIMAAQMPPKYLTCYFYWDANNNGRWETRDYLIGYKEFGNSRKIEVLVNFKVTDQWRRVFMVWKIAEDAPGLENSISYQIKDRTWFRFSGEVDLNGIDQNSGQSWGEQEEK